MGKDYDEDSEDESYSRDNRRKRRMVDYSEDDDEENNYTAASRRSSRLTRGDDRLSRREAPNKRRKQTDESLENEYQFDGEVAPQSNEIRLDG